MVLVQNDEAQNDKGSGKNLKKKRRKRTKTPCRGKQNLKFQGKKKKRKKDAADDA